ncbi:MAG: hypothetical protein ABIQ59_09505 [Nocardioidaceae bacterium]
MRARLGLAPLLLSLAVTSVLLSGCDGASSGAAAGASSTPATGGLRPPVLGGDAPREQQPPDRPMDSLEEPVHARLAAQIAGQGLHLDYLDCPRWDGSVPWRLTCRGYLDGLVARVGVRLKAAVEGKAVGFDARLLDGVIATRKLEKTLRGQGWKEADCGQRAAYPAEPGSRIVCHVRRPGDDRYVVATVSDRSGAVMIADYRPTS